MLHKFLSSVRRSGHGTSLDHYYGSLNSKGESGGPTFDEARKDYGRFVKDISRSPWM